MIYEANRLAPAKKTFFNIFITVRSSPGARYLAPAPRLQQNVRMTTQPHKSLFILLCRHFYRILFVVLRIIFLLIILTAHSFLL